MLSLDKEISKHFKWPFAKKRNKRFQVKILRNLLFSIYFYARKIKKKWDYESMVELKFDLKKEEEEEEKSPSIRTQ